MEFTLLLSLIIAMHITIGLLFKTRRLYVIFTESLFYYKTNYNQFVIRNKDNYIVYVQWNRDNRYNYPRLFIVLKFPLFNFPCREGFDLYFNFFICITFLVFIETKVVLFGNNYYYIQPDAEAYCSKTYKNGTLYSFEDDEKNVTKNYWTSIVFNERTKKYEFGNGLNDGRMLCVGAIEFRTSKCCETKKNFICKSSQEQPITNGNYCFYILVLFCFSLLYFWKFTVREQWCGINLNSYLQAFQ